MSEEEYFQWRLFYPLPARDEQMSREKHPPFTLMTKLNILAITDDKSSHPSSYIDIYYPLDSTDVCLKVHDVERVARIEIRNRQKEFPLSSIQHWSIYEIKYPHLDLPDKILSRLDRSTVEKIRRYLQFINTDEKLFDFSVIRVQKNQSTWHVNDSDRQIEESDIHLLTNDDLSKETNECFYVPKSWRTLAIQSADHEQLLKTLTTLQIEEDKDLLDYFSFLISQTHFHSFSRHSQEQLLSTSSSERAYMSLLTMSYAAFIELLHQRMAVTH